MGPAVVLLLICNIVAAAESRGSDNKEDKHFDLFQCVYLDDNIECSWQANTKCFYWNVTFGPANQRVDKVYMPHEQYSCNKGQCNQIIHSTYCFNYDNTPCLYPDESYAFNLHGICQDYAIDDRVIITLNETYVQLKPVEVVFNATTNHSLTIGWKIGKPPWYSGSGDISLVLCQLYVQPGNTIFNITSNTDLLESTVDELLPGTRYNLSMQCRLAASVVGWSNIVTKEFATDFTVPIIGPSMTSAGFIITGNVVIIYLLAPKGYTAQGNVSEIKFELQSEGCRSCRRYANQTQTAELKTCWAKISDKLNVTATARNQIGWSTNSTYVEYVQNKAVPIPSYIMAEVNKTTGEFRISLEQNFTVQVNITYFWCRGQRKRSQPEVVLCQDSLNWTVSPNFSYHGTIQNGLRGEWHFGTSIQSGQNSSGVRWEDCIFEQSKRDTEERKPKILTLGPTSVNVLIPRSFCIWNEYRPLYYVLEVGYMNDIVNTTRLNIKATSLVSNITMKGLVPDTAYQLNFSTEYNYGMSRPVSTNFKTQTSSTHQSTTPSYIMISIIVSVAVVFILCVVCLAEWCKDKLYKFCKSPEIDDVNVTVSSFKKQEEFIIKPISRNGRYSSMNNLLTSLNGSNSSEVSEQDTRHMLQHTTDVLYCRTGLTTTENQQYSYLSDVQSSQDFDHECSSYNNLTINITSSSESNEIHLNDYSQTCITGTADNHNNCSDEMNCLTDPHKNSESYIERDVIQNHCSSEEGYGTDDHQRTDVSISSYSLTGNIPKTPSDNIPSWNSQNEITTENSNSGWVASFENKDSDDYVDHHELICLSRHQLQTTKQEGNGISVSPLIHANSIPTTSFDYMEHYNSRDKIDDKNSDNDKNMNTFQSENTADTQIGRQIFTIVPAVSFANNSSGYVRVVFEKENSTIQKATDALGLDSSSSNNDIS